MVGALSVDTSAGDPPPLGVVCWRGRGSINILVSKVASDPEPEPKRLHCIQHRLNVDSLAGDELSAKNVKPMLAALPCGVQVSGASKLTELKQKAGHAWCHCEQV